MPQGRARRYIHLIDLQGQASTGQTQNIGFNSSVIRKTNPNAIK